jgi:homocysteine S-methyltransferase
VELDPPKDDSGEKFMASARELAQAGVDAITIADCPIARPRMDSSLLACKLHRELGIDPLPHMTCRDRNLNATKALLLGLCMEGVHNVLTITGDPIPSAERDEVKSVYQFHSRKLARYVTSLNENELTTPFRIFGALNVNSHNFAIQLNMAREKVDCGITGFLTQPVLTEAALENLKLARETLPPT